MAEKWRPYRSIGKELVERYGQSGEMNLLDKETDILSVLCYLTKEVSELKNLLTVLSLDRLHVARASHEDWRQRNQELDNWIQAKEARHGPIPKRVRSYISSQWLAVWDGLNTMRLPWVEEDGSIFGITRRSIIIPGPKWEPKFTTRSKVAKEYQDWVGTVRKPDRSASPSESN